MHVYEYRVRRVRRSCAADVSRFSNPAEAAKAFSRFVEGEPREMFLVASLDSRNACMGIEIVAVGGLSSVDVHPREVFRAALLASAAGIVVCHNHPSDLTTRLISSGEILGIPLLDHIIVGDDSYVSLRERNSSLWTF